MKHSGYWRKRFEELEKALLRQGVSVYGDIEKEYKKAIKSIEKDITIWYNRLAAGNEISFLEAKKLLSAGELEEFHWDVEEYIKRGEENSISGKWAKQLENASAKVHISKLEAAKLQIQQHLEALFGNQLDAIDKSMRKIYSDGFYKTAFEVQKGFGVGYDFSKLDTDKIDSVMAKPWAADGKDFSSRVWQSKDKLVNTLHTELAQAVIRGDTLEAVVRNMAKRLNSSKYAAGRLVMTESAFFAAKGQQDGFNALGVERYEIVATLDMKTSEKCRSLDGKVFKMSEFAVGVTAPPFHCWCRTCIAPYFDDKGERASRGKDGKIYYVPSNMKYEEWKKKFVDGDKSGFAAYTKNGVEHYKKLKKEYLTKKKLQANIANIDASLEDLEIKFKEQSGGWSYDEIVKDFGSLEKFAKGEEFSKMAKLHSQMEELQAQKAEWEEKLKEKLIAEQKKALVKQQMELQEQKAALQKQLDDFEVKTYSGIWKDDVTTADWGSLNIEGKKKYYEGKFITETDPDLMQKYQDLYKQLQELDTEGKSYYDVQQEMKKIESEISKVQSDLKKVENGGIMDAVDDTFSQARKDSAIWAKSTKEADAVLRDTCGEVWRTSTATERNAIYDYTTSYHKFNDPLRGIEYGTNAFKGVGNVDLDQIGVSYSGFKPGAMRKEINAMTDIISKSTYKEDFWLQRGCRFSGMDKFFNVSMDQLMHSTQAELEQLLLGTTPTEYGFCSCGVAKGKGFSGDIILNIYAPSGTQMMYAEPFSAFGNGGGKKWDGISAQGTFGQESEIILQQGTTFRVTKVEKTNSMIYIDLEVIGQNPQR
jgi:SPP1 gp7 family putative phage head morphogenesis protein